MFSLLNVRKIKLYGYVLQTGFLEFIIIFLMLQSSIGPNTFSSWWIVCACGIKSFADAEVLEKLPPDSTEQQAQITAIQNDDGYNWG